VRYSSRSPSGDQVGASAPPSARVRATPPSAGDPDRAGAGGERQRLAVRGEGRLELVARVLGDPERPADPDLLDDDVERSFPVGRVGDEVPVGRDRRVAMERPPPRQRAHDDAGAEDGRRGRALRQGPPGQPARQGACPNPIPAQRQAEARPRRRSASPLRRPGGAQVDEQVVHALMRPASFWSALPTIRTASAGTPGWSTSRGMVPSTRSPPRHRSRR
jgi:hypothetical protein